MSSVHCLPFLLSVPEFTHDLRKCGYNAQKLTFSIRDKRIFPDIQQITGFELLWHFQSSRSVGERISGALTTQTIEQLSHRFMR